MTRNQIGSILERVEERLAVVGMTASAASVAAGMSNSLIRNWQKKRDGKPGSAPTVESIQRLAPVLRSPVAYLLEGVGPSDSADISNIDVRNSHVAGLPVLGAINAGVWKDTSIFDQDSEARMLPVPGNQRFPHARQYYLEVIGDSMDLKYPDRSFVACVDFAESGLALKEGMTVHVERRRFGGQLVEITLKTVEKHDGVLTLVPKSSNPKHLPFPMPKFRDGALKTTMGDAEIFVRGVVIGMYQEEKL